jgi:ribosomal protein L11 methyltransferase
VLSYSPFLVGSRFRVVPPGTPPSDDGRLDLVVPRGAFGSGEHETTVSCLEMLEGLGDLRGARALDLGSGTGILAIAALALGAGRAVLVDNDPRTVEAARPHCAHNGVGDRVEIVHGELRDVRETDFDLLLANIYGDILLRLAPELVARAGRGARLECELKGNRFLDEYSTLLLRHPG